MQIKIEINRDWCVHRKYCLRGVQVSLHASCNSEYKNIFAISPEWTDFGVLIHARTHVGGNCVRSFINKMKIRLFRMNVGRNDNIHPEPIDVYAC